MKVLDFSGLVEFAKKIKQSLDKKVDKEDGKALSRNDFTDLDKDRLDNVSVKYDGDTIYDVKIVAKNGKLFYKYDELGRIIANDFYKANVSGESFKFRIKSSSEGIILLYSLKDADLKYAVHVYKNIRDYEIHFNKTYNGELIFASVTMPEDSIQVIVD